MKIIETLINGLSLGGTYAMIALGYTMVYGIIKLINFAHGEVYMVGSYVGYTVIRNFNLGLIPALLFSMVFCIFSRYTDYTIQHFFLKSTAKTVLWNKKNHKVFEKNCDWRYITLTVWYVYALLLKFMEVTP